MAAIPVISSHVLHGMPAFVRREMGGRALQRVNRAVGLDLEMLENESCFIPHATVVGFLNSTAQVAGEANLGIQIAPLMDVANYGSYGRYVYGAETLGKAIERAISGLRFHSSDDRMSIALTGDEVRYSYVFALSAHAGYAHAVGAAAGVLLSLFRAYLPFGWRPLRIELDIAKPARPDIFECAFQCPVHFDAPAVTIVTERHLLGTARAVVSEPIVTIEDVARDRRGNAPQEIVDVLAEHIRAQVLTGKVSIDSAARSMDTSIRTLQRELNRAGSDFRSLASAVRIGRAAELLRHSNGSVTRVSAELGYSSPANFARAFRKVTGVAPREFRLTV